MKAYLRMGAQTPGGFNDFTLGGSQIERRCEFGQQIG